MAHRHFIIIHAALAAAVVVMERCATMIGNAVDHFIEAVMAMVPASPKLVLAGGYRMDLTARGTGLDRALQNDLRHEAGVSRRSAERFI